MRVLIMDTLTTIAQGADSQHSHLNTNNIVDVGQNLSHRAQSLDHTWNRVYTDRHDTD